MATPSPTADAPPSADARTVKGTAPTRWRRIAAGLSPAAQRTRGEWATDGLLFVAALLWWAWSATPTFAPQVPAALLPLDLMIGAIAVAAVWWTRRRPVLVALVMLAPGTLAMSAGAAVLIGIARLGLLAPVRTGCVITALHIVLALPYHAVLPVPGMTWPAWLIFIPLVYALCFTTGLLGRARRQALVNLREAAARDRERYEERLATAQRDERQRIAREMHDVLAHRISLLSMHAGALEFRATSPSPPDTAELVASARVIRDSARAAVEDLRELLGLLRSDDELGTGAPQPRLTGLEDLVRDASSAGQRVELRNDARPERMRETTQRTAYRVVQEALTNARKHAPHAPVTVRLSQDRALLTIVATNPIAPGLTRWDIGPAGNGLIGLEERVRIDGGSLDAEVVNGEFRLSARLPIGSP